ncbi:MAG: zinc-binding dehydrogenase [Patescibacteria group bacterium]
MKAAILQSPGVLEVRHVAEPVLGEYDALCATVCASICNGTDHHALRGDAFFKIPFPTILGHEGIGRVLETGPRVRTFHVDDLVTRVVNRLPPESGINAKDSWGSFAERGIVTDWQAMRDDGLTESVWRPHMIHQTLPPDADPINSTMVITWRETLSFFRRLGATQSDNLLVIGTGANALAFVEHARNSGLDITVCGSPEREGLFKSAGAGRFISYRDAELTAALTAADPFDIILDAIGKSAMADNCLPALKTGGKIGVYGLDGALDYHLDDALVRGFKIFDGTDYAEGVAHDEVLERISKNQLNADLYFSPNHVYPLERIHDALAASRERKVLKSVIDFRLN